MDDIQTNDAEEKTVTAPTASANATLLGASVTCPVCKTENAPGEKYCGECGFLLSSTLEDVGPVEYPAATCRLIDPSGQREYLLRDGENTVGRESADVLLGDPTVSRKHALLIVESGRCWVEDAGSTNGTYVSGRQIQPGERVEISDGDELKFGSVALSMSIPACEGSAVARASTFGKPTADKLVGKSEEAVIPVPSQDAQAGEEAQVAAADDEIEEAPRHRGQASEVVPEETAVARLLLADGAEFAVMPGSNTIGRRLGNDIVLAGDPYVSGSHAEVIADERGFWLVDTGSTNGTTLNGSRIEPGTWMALNHDDEIMCGQTTLKFQFLQSPEPSEEAASEFQEDLPA